jgi:hypothetical protein
VLVIVSCRTTLTITFSVGESVLGWSYRQPGTEILKHYFRSTLHSFFYQIWHARITTERSTENSLLQSPTRILLNIATTRQYHNRVHKYILGQHYLEASRSTRQESVNKHKNLVQEKGSGTASTQCPQSPPSGTGTTSPSEAFDPKPLMSPYVYQSQIESAYVFLCLSYQSAQIPKSYGAFEGGTDEEREVELTLMVL